MASLPSAPSPSAGRRVPAVDAVGRSASISTVLSASTITSTRPSTPLASILRRCRSTPRRPSTHEGMPWLPVPASRDSLALTVSPAEFRSLPPSVQKKCFSPSERLSIAQTAARQRRQVDSILLDSPPLPSDANMPHSRRRSRPLAKPRTGSVADVKEPMLDTMSQAQALWFLDLPEKIRRQRFSKEELAALTDACQRVLQSSRPESAATSAFSHSVTAPSPVSAQHKQLSICSSRSTSPEPRALRSSRHRSISKTLVPPAPVSASSRPESPFAASTPDLLLSPAVNPASKSPALPEQRRPSLRSPETSYYRAPVRRKSLTPIALPPPTLSPAPQVPPIEPKSVSAYRPRSRTSPAPNPAKESAPATYFQNEQMKHTLRVSTASSHAFDEVVQYGFPTMCSECSAKRGEAAGNRDHPSPSTSRPFLLDNSDTDDESSRGPLTPNFRLDNIPVTREPRKVSMDSGVALPLYANGPWNDHLIAVEVKTPREPTLRLTLTRPELRDRVSLLTYDRPVTRSTSDLDRSSDAFTASRPSLHLQTRPKIHEHSHARFDNDTDGRSSVFTARSTKNSLFRFLKKL